MRVIIKRILIVLGILGVAAAFQQDAPMQDAPRMVQSIEITEITQNGYYLQVTHDTLEAGTLGKLRVIIDYGDAQAVREVTIAGGGIGRDGQVATKSVISGSWPQRVVTNEQGKEFLELHKPSKIRAEFEPYKDTNAVLDFYVQPFEYTPYEIHHSIALVQNSGIQLGENVVDDSFTFATTPVVGNHISALVDGWNTSGFTLNDVTDNKSNSYTVDIQQTSAGGNARASISTAKIDTSSATFTVTVDPVNASGNYMGWTVQEWSGWAATSWVDKTGQTSAGAGSTSSTVTATAANSQNEMLVLAVVEVSSNDTNVNLSTPASSGYTSLGVHHDSAQVMGYEGSYKLINSAETSSASWTFDSATSGSGSVILTVKAAIVGTGDADFTSKGDSASKGDTQVK